MPLIAEVGTDVASLSVWDKSLLPEDFDARFDEHYAAISQNESIRGLFPIETGADGAWLIHIYVDEAVPDSLKRHFELEPRIVERFETESGELTVSGSEYTHKRENTLLKRYPDNAVNLKFPAGNYRVGIHPTTFGEEPESEFQASLTTEEKKLWRLQGARPWVVVSSLLLILIFCILQIWMATVVTVVIAIAAWIVIGIFRKKAAPLRDRWNSIQLKYPSLVLVFESV